MPLEKKKLEKLKAISKKPYKEQAIWYLNAFWTKAFDKSNANCEKVWAYLNKFIELDIKKKKKGCELNEFDAHRFLEFFGQTLSVSDMRKKLREIDIDFNKKVSLTEYLIFEFGGDVETLVTASQGEKDMDKINQAQKLLDDAQSDCENAKKAAEEAKVAAEKAKESKLLAIKAENEAKHVESALRAAQAEQKAAEDALHMQETKLNNKKEKLKAKSLDSKLGVVKRNKAANQLEQLNAKDPFPLQKAKIPQAAVVKKCAKATKKAAKATAKAVAAREVAESDEKQAQDAKQASDDAVLTAEKAIDAATEFLEKVKEECKGAGKGKLWMMDRELAEAKKYMPKSKYAKLKKKMEAEKKA
eukprot:CAMPEP_0197514768 /NCGR_PEP_ID=MMETSP1318-20131121/109_1 /TAXON_ID=552666 /ORGANISM="Partenskyella glossopodia, Strain RCC365" /LENGTH=358 /DNA_ID=CAMNT_0043062957 /DNA_START=437 /DNA_END=1513 /DNA_ORIENTATION=-